METTHMLEPPLLLDNHTPMMHWCCYRATRVARGAKLRQNLREIDMRLTALLLTTLATIAQAEPLECHSRKDEMTGKVSHSASVLSSNRVAPLPWEKPDTGVMLQSSSGVSVLLPGVGIVECRACDVRVKVDGVLRTVRGEESGQWLGLDGLNVMGAREVVIEVPVFRSKGAVFTFEPVGPACLVD